MEIEVLDGIEAIRRRPSLYVGDPKSSEATTIMLLEPLCFAIDKPGGPAANLMVTVHRNRSASIANDGPGVPVEVDQRFGKSLLDALMTTLFTCRDLKTSEDEAAWCRCGVTITNALSRWCTVLVQRNGRRIERRYESGRAVGGFRDTGACQVSGTIVTFEPDPALVSSDFDIESIRNGLTVFAQAFPCIGIELTDERRDDPIVWRGDAGKPWRVD
jgi:DNA gyrase subunit B